LLKAELFLPPEKGCSVEEESEQRDPSQVVMMTPDAPVGVSGDNGGETMWQKGFCFRGGEGGMLGLLESGKGRFRGSARVSSLRSVLPRPCMFQGEKERSRSTNHRTKKALERSTDITLNSSQTRKCTDYTGGSGTGTPTTITME